MHTHIHCLHFIYLSTSKYRTHCCKCNWSLKHLQKSPNHHLKIKPKTLHKHKNQTEDTYLTAVHVSYIQMIWYVWITQKGLSLLICDQTLKHSPSLCPRYNQHSNQHDKWWRTLSSLEKFVTYKNNTEKSENIYKRNGEIQTGFIIL